MPTFSESPFGARPSRNTSSGRLLRARTELVTEPSTSPASAPWPCEPITIRSALPRSAASAISSAGCPTRQRLCACRPAFFSVLTAERSALFASSS
jgi:hypothetical protein